MINSVYDKLKNTDIPIYIYGAGEIADLTVSKLNYHGIHVDGFVVDDEYVKEGNLKKSDLISRNEPYVLIRGVWNCFFRSDEELISEWKGCQCIFQCADIYECDNIEPISETFYLDNKDLFERVHNNLFDEMSKASYTAFIKSKIENDNMYLIPHVVTPQYYFSDAPWTLDKNECLVDCGAYDGDSIRDFVDFTHNQYEYIYAFEPDKDNIIMLNHTIQRKRIKNVEVIPKACGDKKCILRFSANGVGGRISENGDIEIQVDTIDNVVSKDKRISIIKMDIEGAEVAAINGAKNTIQKDRPILMISIYHKKDDLYHVFDTIDSMVEDYVFYLRIHKVFAVDVVLYAVPKERIKETDEKIEKITQYFKRRSSR